MLLVKPVTTFGSSRTGGQGAYGSYETKLGSESEAGASGEKYCHPIDKQAAQELWQKGTGKFEGIRGKA